MANEFEDRPAPETITPFTPAPDTGVLGKAAETVAQVAQWVHDALKGAPKRSGAALLCYILLRDSGTQRKIIASDELEKLRGANAKAEKVQTAIEYYTRENAYNAWLEHSKDLQQSIHDGDSLKQKHSMTREEYERDFVNKQQAAHREAQRLYSEHFPLCSEIADRFLVLATDRADGMEESERSQHAYYGIPYAGPSNVVKAFKAAVKSVKAQNVFNGYGNQSPRQLLPYIDF